MIGEISREAFLKLVEFHHLFDTLEGFDYVSFYAAPSRLGYVARDQKDPSQHMFMGIVQVGGHYIPHSCPDRGLTLQEATDDLLGFLALPTNPLQLDYTAVEVGPRAYEPVIYYATPVMQEFWLHTGEMPEFARVHTLPLEPSLASAMDAGLNFLKWGQFRRQSLAMG